jgi:hypothetical protein
VTTASPTDGGTAGNLPPVGFDLALLERELCRVPEIRAARIVADPSGTPIEVHVLAVPGKHAKQLVRDVQSVAMATAGVEIDHRTVSVVQLDDDATTASGAPAPPAAAPSPDGNGADPAAGPPPERVLVGAVTVRRGGTFAAEVSLELGDETATGSAEGPAAGSISLRLVAGATLDALAHFFPAAAAAAVDSAVITAVGDHRVAVTAVMLVGPGGEELVTGSAPVRSGGDQEAVARAVLDATNRRLARRR